MRCDVGTGAPRAADLGSEDLLTLTLSPCKRRERLPFSEIDAGFLHVVPRALEEMGELLLGDLAHHLAGATEHERPGRNHLALRDKGIGADDAAPTDGAAGKQNGVHPDQGLP